MGDSWRDSMTVALEADGQQITYVATFTLRRMEGRVAVIGLEGTMTTTDPAAAASMSFAVAGEVRLDLAAGQPSGMALTMEGVTPTPAGDMPMTVHVKLTPL
jgi:hypothetical protein